MGAEPSSRRSDLCSPRCGRFRVCPGSLLASPVILDVQPCGDRTGAQSRGPPFGDNQPRWAGPYPRPSAGAGHVVCTDSLDHSCTAGCGRTADSCALDLWTLRCRPQVDSRVLTPDARSSSMVAMALSSSTPLPHRTRAAALCSTVALLALLAALLPVLPLPGLAVTAAAAPSATSATWVTPVPAMEIVTAFDPPKETWLAGHRGIDVRAVPDEPMRAPTAGTVRFRGRWQGPTR